MPCSTIILQTGQAISWPPSPLGFAQITELCRTTVRLGYRNSRGNWRHPIVRVARIAEAQHRLLLELDNPYDRGLVRRERRYVISVPRCRVCGCTDANCSGCIERTGQPCYWIEPDLCSACRASPRRVNARSVK